MDSCLVCRMNWSDWVDAAWACRDNLLISTSPFLRLMEKRMGLLSINCGGSGKGENV